METTRSSATTPRARARVSADGIIERFRQLHTVGIGYDTTSSASGFTAAVPLYTGTGRTTKIFMRGEDLPVPVLGLNTTAAIESGSTGFFGKETNMQLSVTWNG